MPPGAVKEPRWLLLIHQIPPKPNYLRVKIGRRLQRLGAVAIKNSVYALPSNEQAREDFNWVLREIVEGGGDGSLVDGQFVEGLSDEQIEELFRSARDAEYQEVAADARELAKHFPRRGSPSEENRPALEAQLAKLQKRIAAIAALDHFHARGREPVEGLLAELATRLAQPAAKPASPQEALEKPRRATWVTRTGIHVDRMASAWLIRRFIDPEARFRFVSTKEYRHKAGELRFDMFEGEFTHQGELCSFEVLLSRFELSEPALRPIAEIVHDIDLKDDKYGRAQTAGIESVINAIAMAHREDEERLARASALLDDLYQYFKRKRADRGRGEGA